MRTIREDYLIKVVGSQDGDDGQKDTVSLVTKGEFNHKDRSFYITYKETDATGYAGCTTTVKAEENGRRVSMLRFGPVPGQLVVEKGVRHICHYETGQGSLSLGLTADEIIGGKTWAALEAPVVEDEPTEPEDAWAMMTMAEKVEYLHKELLALRGGGGNG